MRAFAIACLAACSYTSPSAAVDSVDTAIDTPVPPADPDGDGLSGTDDNCPTDANADQHDEDGDARGDVCDPCPQLAGASGNVDTDGDLVGDLCDPRPMVDGDMLLKLETFASGTGLPTGWGSIAGAPANWVIANDALVNAAGDATAMVLLDTGAGSRTIDIGIEITSANTTTDTVGVGAVIDGNGTQASFYMCFVQTVAATQFTQLFGPGTTTLASAQLVPAFPGRYRIVTSFDGAQLRCNFDGPNAPSDLATTPAPLGGTRVGIRMRNISAKVEYVAIYRTP